MALDDDDLTAIREVVSTIAHEVAGDISQKQTIKIVHTTLQAMGMDIRNPLELQQDFAHLRKDRMDTHDTKKAAKDAVVRWGITGVFAAAVAWLAANSPLWPH